jgi:hypothetical protein
MLSAGIRGNWGALLDNQVKADTAHRETIGRFNAIIKGIQGMYPRR